MMVKIVKRYMKAKRTIGIQNERGSFHIKWNTFYRYGENILKYFVHQHSRRSLITRTISELITG